MGLITFVAYAAFADVPLKAVENVGGIRKHANICQKDHDDGTEGKKNQEKETNTSISINRSSRKTTIKKTDACNLVMYYLPVKEKA